MSEVMSKMYRQVLLGAMITARDALDTAILIFRGGMTETEGDQEPKSRDSQQRPATFNQRQADGGARADDGTGG